MSGLYASRSLGERGRFLGPSISSFYRRYPLPAQLDMWRAAGLTQVRARVVSLGGGVVIRGTKATEADAAGGEAAGGYATA